MNRIILVNTEDGHNKFWAIESANSGRALRCYWGRIPSDGPRAAIKYGEGQSKLFLFDTPTGARAYAFRKLNEKLGKGYVKAA